MIPHTFVEFCFCVAAGFSFGMGFALAQKLVGLFSK